MPERIHALWNARFLNQIIESMADGVFTLDADGRITSWNPAMERICGYSAAEALGQTCRILGCSRCFGRDCPVDHNACGLLREGRAEDNECLLQHRDGHSVPVIKNARAVRDDTGKIIGAVETVTDLTELKKARQAADAALQRLEERFRFANIIGKSKGMQDVFDAIQAAAASRATVLIDGESGTGKELVAAAIHYNSDVAAQPMVTVNCSALSETLLESELFGHTRGAFTGAHRDRMGRFEEADGGTIFLDEIGELSPFIQVKLLRVLQEREIERVGDSRRRKIDIRVIAATHRDLYALVQQGTFREDLYYRLKVFPICLPPLRERREDIPLLVNHFIGRQNQATGKQIHGVTQTAMRHLLDYPWPGNVRELENAIEHAFVICRHEEIDTRDLPAEIRLGHRLPPPATAAAPPRHYRVARDLTRERLVELLDASGWNKAEAARRLGISRTAVWKYMKKWEIPLRGEG
jgi:two-component system, NtrC family, response regulator HydG